MKNSKFIIVGIIIVILLGLGLFAWRLRPTVSQYTPAAETTLRETAILEIFSPSVWVIAPGNSEKVEGKTGQEVAVGSQIVTGDKGRAQLLYPNHTVTRLDYNTQITFEELTPSPQKVKVKLEKNRIWSRVAKLLGQESYQSETNTTVATVRGTSYGHEKLTNGTDKIISSKRDVEGACLNQSQEDTIKQGTRTVFTCIKGQPFDEQSLTGTDTDDEWYIFNNLEDKTLDSRFGASIYDDEAGVLGLETELGSFIPVATPGSRVSLISCTGADGKISFVSQTVCDFVNKFWQDHPPAPYTGGANAETSSSTTANPSPSPSPDTTGPTITNFSSPTFASSTTCPLSFAADINDPSGISTASASWQSFYNNSTPYVSDSAAMTGPVGGGTWSSTQDVFIPPDGFLEWLVTAMDDSSSLNQTSSASGIIVNTDFQGCGFNGF